MYFLAAWIMVFVARHGRFEGGVLLGEQVVGVLVVAGQVPGDLPVRVDLDVTCGQAIDGG